jgi:hypothetical protein
LKTIFDLAQTDLTMLQQFRKNKKAFANAVGTKMRAGGTFFDCGLWISDCGIRISDDWFGSEALEYNRERGR